MKGIIKRPLPHEVWPPEATEEELKELSTQRNLDIGIRGRTGPIKELEENFIDFLEGGVKYAITFNSGTSALLAAYFGVGVGTGDVDEVIGPALTYHAALSPVNILRGNVVLADIDLNTRCINPDKIEGLITENTRAITVVHQWGHPAQMDKILAIAEKHRLFVIEDCSHAHGSSYKGKLCGTFGDVAVFSLQTNKAIFAGEGGILVTNNRRIHDRATLLGHYRDRCKEEINDEELKDYWSTGFGLKLRMSPFNAIVAKHSLRRFPEIKNGRHKCLKYFIERLKEVEYIQPLELNDDVDMGAWYGFKPLYLPKKLNNMSREKLIELLRKEGMEVGAPSGKVLATTPLYNSTFDLLFGRIDKKPNNIDTLPNAMLVQEQAISLPTFYNWEKDKELIDQYIEVFKKIWQEHKK